MELRGNSISFSSYKQKERNIKEQKLTEDIKVMESKLDEQNIEPLEILITELNNIRQGKLKGHIIRSRVQHIDQGEKPTKYFLGLEQHNYI